MASAEKTSPNTTPMEPKKSVRLAQKRKMREEAGPQTAEDDYYFTPYQFSKSNSPSRVKASPSASGSNSPTPTSSGPPMKKLKTKSETGSESPSSSVSPKTQQQSSLKLASGSPKLSQLLSSPVRRILSKTGTISEDSSTSSGGQLSFSSAVITKPKKSKSNTPGAAVVDEEALEEEKWLDALEAGKLEELDEELRQMKNPKLLTARQRAIMEKKDKDVYGFTIDEDSGLDSYRKNKEKLVITQEMIKLKAEKMEKRRQLAQEKKEIDRKKTMDRLLKKQHSKVLKVVNKPKRKLGPTDLKVTFISRAEGNIIAFPPEFPLPFEVPHPPRPIAPLVCRAEGCTNPRKYTCSKTGVPVCSLECYKKNLASYQF